MAHLPLIVGTVDIDNMVAFFFALISLLFGQVLQLNVILTLKYFSIQNNSRPNNLLRLDRDSFQTNNTNRRSCRKPMRC